ncbi:hypothetical protein [Salegentibacter maritimus]|uniref:DNA recombination protein RmuC n=1 Tax=Salegentibacter maritimus TaxID=2794347 RepID=A0ABS0TJ22_9FLAO|nr:hypothetical protein [Salegentibacter maritimus]MBI6121022.1 hypothetical protein [Salegentibacter maritimus]
MEIIQLILAAAVGGASSYLYFQKNNKALKEDLHKVNRELSETRIRSSQEFKDLEAQLQSKIKELKKSRKETEESEDILHDLKGEFSKAKEVNKSLKEEIVKLTSSIREYEMLYNAKKDEIEKLKN